MAASAEEAAATAADVATATESRESFENTGRTSRSALFLFCLKKNQRGGGGGFSELCVEVFGVGAGVAVVAGTEDSGAGAAEGSGIFEGTGTVGSTAGAFTFGAPTDSSAGLRDGLRACCAGRVFAAVGAGSEAACGVTAEFSAGPVEETGAGDAGAVSRTGGGTGMGAVSAAAGGASFAARLERITEYATAPPKATRMAPKMRTRRLLDCSCRLISPRIVG